MNEAILKKFEEKSLRQLWTKEFWINRSILNVYSSTEMTVKNCSQKCVRDRQRHMNVGFNLNCTEEEFHIAILFKPPSHSTGMMHENTGFFNASPTHTPQLNLATGFLSPIDKLFVLTNLDTH